MGFMTSPGSIHPIVSGLVPLLRQLARDGEYAIALGGSYAQRTADHEADVDLYLFTRAVLSKQERSRIATARPR